MSMNSQQRSIFNRKLVIPLVCCTFGAVSAMNGGVVDRLRGWRDRVMQHFATSRERDQLDSLEKQVDGSRQTVEQLTQQRGVLDEQIRELEGQQGRISQRLEQETKLLQNVTKVLSTGVRAEGAPTPEEVERDAATLLERTQRAREDLRACEQALCQLYSSRRQLEARLGAAGSLLEHQESDLQVRRAHFAGTEAYQQAMKAARLEAGAR